MEAFPNFQFPSNKRYAMHFRHQNPTEEFITARFPNPKTGHLSPSNVSISTYHTPDSIEEALNLSRTFTPPQQDSKHSTPPRQPLPRSQSSSWWMEIRKSPTPKQEPRSRKTSEATIRTDATETQAAFESDAFAVHMPTTREPILESPVFRAKLPSPTKGQVEAYETYKRKAQLVREKHIQDGVRVPSKMISYDYAHAHAHASSEPEPQELDRNPPSSPPCHKPAGSFPTSPPIVQHGWANPVERVQGSRSMSDSNHGIARKPVGQANIKSNSSRYRYNQRQETVTGASQATSPPKPSTIKVRIKPKAQDSDRPQKESWWSLYNRSPQASSDGSSSPSPTKVNFAYTSHAEAAFGYGSHDMAGTVAGASKSTPPTATKTAAKSTSRWAWLRPAGPRISKPTVTQISTPRTIKPRAYVDPFVLHASPVPTQPNSPTASRPGSPKKLLRAQHPPVSGERGKFETGFAQVKSFASLILKLCLLIYMLVGLYFLLDAVREAVRALGAPFRGMRFVGRYLWIAGAWMGAMLGKCWDRWGVKVAFKGGWRRW